MIEKHNPLAQRLKNKPENKGGCEMKGELSNEQGVREINSQQHE